MTRVEVNAGGYPLHEHCVHLAEDDVYAVISVLELLNKLQVYCASALSPLHLYKLD